MRRLRRCVGAVRRWAGPRVDFGAATLDDEPAKPVEPAVKVLGPVPESACDLDLRCDDGSCWYCGRVHS